MKKRQLNKIKISGKIDLKFYSRSFFFNSPYRSDMTKNLDLINSWKEKQQQQQQEKMETICFSHGFCHDDHR